MSEPKSRYKGSSSGVSSQPVHQLLAITTTLPILAIKAPEAHTGRDCGASSATGRYRHPSARATRARVSLGLLIAPSTVDLVFISAALALVVHGATAVHCAFIPTPVPIPGPADQGPGSPLMTDPTYVLVPGAGGDAWYWHRVEAELRSRGRGVIAVDLPGDDESAGLPEYTDMVVEAVGERTGLVLVGQSLGAFTASLACARLPASLLVLVNAMIPKPGETPGEWWENTGHAEAKRENDVREGRPADGEFDVATYFLHDLPEQVIGEAGAHARPESDAVFASRWGLPAWPDVPTRVLIGRNDRFFPAEFQRRVARDRLGITPQEMPGGHLAALSRPVALADWLETYWAEVNRAA